MQPQIILITGASSRFGKITAQVLPEQSYIVYGTSWKPSEGIGKVQMPVVNVANSISVRQIVEQIIPEQGQMDVLINNAGMGIGGTLELATEKEVSMQMSTNFSGVVSMYKAVLLCMRKACRGKIINISSIGEAMNISYQGSYSAFRLAVEGYSEALALKVHPFHTRVYLVQSEDFNTGSTNNRNISKLTGQNEDYANSFLKSPKIIERGERNGCHPHKLGAAIYKIVTREGPLFRTKVGPLV